MRWFVAIGVACLIARGSLARAAGCPPTYDKGRPGDTLRVGYAESPPFVLARPGGDPDGIAVDALRAVAGDAGWRLQFVELGWESLRDRVRSCAVDIGVTGRPISSGLEVAVDVSQPFWTDHVTVAMRGDVAQTRRPRPSLVGRAGHGAIGGLLAIALLGAGIALVNARAARRRWHRVDGAVAGPISALRWLWWCPSGRLVAAMWLLAGIVVGLAAFDDPHAPGVLGADPAAPLVAAAAGSDEIVGARVPDGAQVRCPSRDARTCMRRLHDGTVSAIAGHRAALCQHARAVALTGLVLRADLAVVQQHGFLLPPASPLAEPVNRALLRRPSQPEIAVRCADGDR